MRWIRVSTSPGTKVSLHSKVFPCKRWCRAVLQGGEKIGARGRYTPCLADRLLLRRPLIYFGYNLCATVLAASVAIGLLRDSTFSSKASIRTFWFLSGCSPAVARKRSK